MAYRVFVGNLPMNIREREVDDLFSKYGRIRDIDLKTPSRPPAYAFITFDDQRDAEDAIRGRDGYDFDGERLRVEFAKGSRDSLRGSARVDDRSRGRGVGRRTEYRVIISGLPRSASWQDLKDHMRKAGDVVYADVDHNGGGEVEFSNREDMDAAVRKLDDTEFKNPFDKAYIRVKYDRKDSRDRSRSRSRSRDSRSRGRSPSASRSRSRSRDRGRRRKKSYSRSPSPSRSRSRSASADRDVKKEKEEKYKDRDEAEDDCDPKDEDIPKEDEVVVEKVKDEEEDGRRDEDDD